MPEGVKFDPNLKPATHQFERANLTEPQAQNPNLPKAAPKRIAEAAKF
ncbi:MAG: hypothetical protein ACFNUU_10275 [Campylobacter sp.]